VQLSAGASPAVVYKQIVNDAPLPLSSADVPTQDQLKYWKRALVMKEMPTSTFLSFSSMTDLCNQMMPFRT
jgi:hypothetical protein